MKGERISTTEVELTDCPTVGLTLGKQTEGCGETEINDDGGCGGDNDDDVDDIYIMMSVCLSVCL